jgi:hypothetical protein
VGERACTSTPKLLPSDTAGAFRRSHISAARNWAAATAASSRTRVESSATFGLMPPFAASTLGFIAACTASRVCAGKCVAKRLAIRCACEGSASIACSPSLMKLSIIGSMSAMVDCERCARARG